MRVLDVQEQSKILEISKDWADKLNRPGANTELRRKEYLENFDIIYKHLVKTISEKQD